MATKEDFLQCVKNHALKILRDDGVYRHVRLKAPKTSNQYFDLITWPNRLCYTGDMGSFLFSRDDDMFAFFRNENVAIKPGYWSEKVEAIDRDGVYELDRDRLCENIKTSFSDWLESKWLDDGDEEAAREALEVLLQEIEDKRSEERIQEIIFDFDFNGENPLEDIACEIPPKKFTYRFLWACRAIVWGIQKYDEARAAGGEK